MMKQLLIMLQLYSLYMYGFEVKHIDVSKLPTINIPKQNKLKAIRKLKKSVAIGGSIGATIPIVNEIFSLPNELSIVKSKIGNSLHDNSIDMTNPSLYTNKVNGNQWSYYKLLTSLGNNDITGISIHQDGKFALVIENTHGKAITPENIHQVITIPNHMNELIEKLIQYDINFDVFT